MQGNETDIPTYESINESHESYINSEFNLRYGVVKFQGNETDIPTYQSIGEFHTSNGNIEPNLANGTDNTGSEVFLII